MRLLEKGESRRIRALGAVNLILATDPDREGEAIAWHIAEMLCQQGSLHENIRVARVVFHEITESAIKAALQAPRDISMNLVNAYLARSALDYLIGFNVSPILWRKLPGCQSAGRVQSAALALVCDREREIEQFKAQEYWTVEADSSSIEVPSLSKATCLKARLTHFNSKKLEKFSITSQEEADSIVQNVSASNFRVEGVNFNKMHKNPLPPYITSTLQQDAANRLSFSAAYTMKLAQKLYEGVKLLNDEATGLITYIRTDSFHVSDEAAQSILEFVSERYGKGFASTCIRKFVKKVTFGREVSLNTNHKNRPRNEHTMYVEKPQNEEKTTEKL
ncbi:DNA topoisomerase 1 [Nymphaea thermarum]|nr:DNA topoisomerase 1 [Nymphaea thermarum]